MVNVLLFYKHKPWCFRCSTDVRHSIFKLRLRAGLLTGAKNKRLFPLNFSVKSFQQRPTHPPLRRTGKAFCLPVRLLMPSSTPSRTPTHAFRYAFPYAYS